jgi:DNA mismatch repair protein MSH2
MQVTEICSTQLILTFYIFFQLLSDESNFGQYTLQTFDFTQFMRLDSAAANALHLTSYGSEPIQLTAKAGPPRTVAALLNKCRWKRITAKTRANFVFLVLFFFFVWNDNYLQLSRTPGGQRLLAQWIKQPLTDKSMIYGITYILKLITSSMYPPLIVSTMFRPHWETFGFGGDIC